MAKTLGHFPGKSEREIEDMLDALKVVIVKTLELTLAFPCDGQSIQSPEPYGEFVRFLERLKTQTDPPHTVTVITFNYDVGIDDALHRNDIAPDYALDEKVPVSARFIPLLKLHGSLNWTETISTVSPKAIVPWGMADYWATHPERDILPHKYCRVGIGSQLIELAAKQGKPITGEAILVPPTLNKAETHRMLGNVWKRAARALSDAENLFVIGYSLPETDMFFHYL
jgi:hypothetical protein